MFDPFNDFNSAGYAAFVVVDKTGVDDHGTTRQNLPGVAGGNFGFGDAAGVDVFGPVLKLLAIGRTQMVGFVVTYTEAWCAFGVAGGVAGSLVFDYLFRAHDYGGGEVRVDVVNRTGIQRQIAQRFYRGAPVVDFTRPAGRWHADHYPVRRRWPCLTN